MSLFFPDLQDLSLEELVECFESGTCQGAELDVLYYMELTVLIREKGKAGNKFLVSQLKDHEHQDEFHLAALLCGLSLRPRKKDGIRKLSRKKRKWFRKQLRRCMDDDRPFVVHEAISGLTHLKKKIAFDRILPFKNHAFDLVREAVIAHLGEFHLKWSFPILVEALQDESEWVRSEAAYQLGHSEKPKAIPLLRPLLDDPEEIVRDSAKSAIEYIEFWVSLYE